MGGGGSMSPKVAHNWSKISQRNSITDIKKHNIKILLQKYKKWCIINGGTQWAPWNSCEAPKQSRQKRLLGNDLDFGQYFWVLVETYFTPFFSGFANKHFNVWTCMFCLRVCLWGGNREKCSLIRICEKLLRQRHWVWIHWSFFTVRVGWLIQT